MVELVETQRPGKNTEYPSKATLSEDLAQSRDERVACFNLIWSGPIAYESLGYFSVFSVLLCSHFVSYKLILWPWVTIMIACIVWTLVYELCLPKSSSLLTNLEGLEVLITMKGGAITFLLAFRLARAAVRFYDARFRLYNKLFVRSFGFDARFK